MKATSTEDVDHLARQAVNGETEIERQLAVSVLRNMVVAGIALNAATSVHTTTYSTADRVQRARTRWSVR